MIPSEGVRNHLKLMNILSFAILSGILIFAGVVWFLLRSGELPPTNIEIPPWVGLLFDAAALVALLTAHFLPWIFGKPERGAPEEAVLAWHRKTVIVGSAFREAAAFIALVGAMLTGGLTGAVTMVGLAVFTMVLAWPRERQLPRMDGG
jgi:hypothetical protein